MSHHLHNTVALLSHTPAALNSLLRDLPDAWTQPNEGEGTWNVPDVLAHLVDGERVDWMPRVNILLQYGETRPFDPYDMDGYLHERQGKSLPLLLDEFARLRSENLAALRALDLQPRDLERRGIHPSLGPVTLFQHLASWAVHDLSHLHQLSRLMAHQYREAVGCWGQYMGVLQCHAHSST